MSKPRQANSRRRVRRRAARFPDADLSQLRAQHAALVADQDGTNRGIHPIE